MFVYNYFFWVIPYFIGLNFTHLDHGIMQKFIIKWSYMKQWPIILWVVFFAAVATVIAILVMLGIEYSRAGILLAYFIFVGSFGVLFCILGRCAKEVHIHHYCIGGFVTAIICY